MNDSNMMLQIQPKNKCNLSGYLASFALNDCPQSRNFLSAFRKHVYLMSHISWSCNVTSLFHFLSVRRILGPKSPDSTVL